MERRACLFDFNLVLDLLTFLSGILGLKVGIIAKDFLILIRVDLILLRQFVLLTNQIVQTFLGELYLPRMLLHRFHWIETGYYEILIIVQPVCYWWVVELGYIERTAHRWWTFLELYFGQSLTVELTVQQLFGIGWLRFVGRLSLSSDPPPPLLNNTSLLVPILHLNLLPSLSKNVIPLQLQFSPTLTFVLRHEFPRKVRFRANLPESIDQPFGWT